MAIRCEQQLENERGDAARETSAAPGRTICKTLAFNEPEALCQSSKLEELLMPAHHSSMKLKHGMYAITPPIAYITPCEASKAYTLLQKDAITKEREAMTRPKNMAARRRYGHRWSANVAIGDRRKISPRPVVPMAGMPDCSCENGLVLL